MTVVRLSRSILLCLLAWLLVMEGWRSLRAADATGLLAAVQPATDGAPAMLRFYSPDAQLVHEIALPAGHTVTAESLSPDGRHWVYLTGAASGPNDLKERKPLQDDLTLHVVRTSDGSEASAIPLLPADFPQNIEANVALLLARDPSLTNDDFLQEAVWAAFTESLGKIAWSPDGKQLAFSAAIDGPSSDLYLYDTETESESGTETGTKNGEVSRLTDGPEQIEGIRWSPDGKWIWHTTISYGYCQACAGHNYAAAADGSGIVTLPGDDIYRFLMWVDEDSYLTTDQANGPGDFGLQLVDIPTANSQMLWEGAHHAFLYDPSNQRLAIIGTRSKQVDPDERVLLIDLAKAETREFDDLASAAQENAWPMTLAEEPSQHPCNRPGPFVYPCNETIYDPYSPDGHVLVDDDYEVNVDRLPAPLFPPLPNIGPGKIFWRPDGQGFFIATPKAIYYRDFGSGEVTTVGEASLLNWLPNGDAEIFVTPKQSSPLPTPSATSQGAQPDAASNAEPTPEITLPYRANTLDGPYPQTAEHYRTVQIQQLATIAQELAGAERPNNYLLQNAELPLLLAHEAAATYLNPPVDQMAAPPLPDEALETQINAALDTALAHSPPLAVSYPALGELPSLYTLAMSPDGRVIATGHSDGSVCLWEYASGNLLRVLPSSTNAIDQLRFSSDSVFLAAVDYEGRTQIWQVDSGLKRALHQGQYLHTGAIAWRPYSYDLAIANGQDPIMIHTGNGSDYPLVSVAAEAMTYSPNGAQLAIALQPNYPTPEKSANEVGAQSGSDAPQQRAIWIVDADSGALLHELADDALTSDLTYTPDSRTLLVIDGNHLRAWDVASATLLFESQLLDFATGYALTLDGSQIAILSRHAGISYYNLSNGENVRNLAVDGDILTQLAINPVDGMLVSAQVTGPPLLLEPESGAIEFHFGAPKEGLVTTSPGSHYFATANMNYVLLHDLSGGRSDRQLSDAEGYINDLAISADGKWLAASEMTGNLLLWELDRAKLQWRKQVATPGPVTIAFTPDNAILIGDSAGHLRLIDPSNGSLVKEMVMEEAVAGLEVSSRNEAAIIVGKGRLTCRLLDLTSWDESAQSAPLPVIDGLERVYDQVAFSPDGSLLAVPRRLDQGAEVTIELWEMESNQRRQTIELGAAYNVKGIAFRPDGQQLAVGADGLNPITIWDVASGERLQAIAEARALASSQRLAYSPDGTQLFATGINLITSQYSLTPTNRLRTIAAHQRDISDLAISPNGQSAITAGDDGHVRVWDWQSGAQSYQAITEPDRVNSVDISHDGYTLLTGGADGVVRLYTSNGEVPDGFRLSDRESDRETEAEIDGEIVDALFSPDGKSVAAAQTNGAEGVVQLRDLASSEPLWTVSGLPHGVTAIAFSPDGRLLAGAADRGPDTTIYLWDAQSGEEVSQLRGHHNEVTSLAFSPAGTLLATASADQTVKLWDVATGAEVATLQGFADRVGDVAFSPDGSELATIDDNYALLRWDVATFRQVGRIDLPHTLPRSLAYSVDGHALLTVHADGKLRTWLVDANDESLPAKSIRAAARVPRPTAEFTANERAIFAIDSYIGAFPLSASANANLRPEPIVQSLVVQPAEAGAPENLVALTNEKFLLTSLDQGESWRIADRLPLTLTYHTLGIPARPSDPLLVTSEEGLYQVGEAGAFTLIHSDALLGVSYSQTDVNELWAVRDTRVEKSEDSGATWGEAGNGLQPLNLFAPLLLTPPNNNPQVLMVEPLNEPYIGLWRGAGNGFWQELPAMPKLPIGVAGDPGMAWDNVNSTLYFSALDGALLASTTLDAPDLAGVTASVVEHFGAGLRPIVLAVGQGPTLYLTLQGYHRPQLLRGEWDGSRWQWLELRLPIVPAG